MGKHSYGNNEKITKNCLCSKTERETRIYTEVDKKH